MPMGEAVKKAFVTGGSGFLGRNLIGYLGRQNIEVLALVRSIDARQVVERAGAKAIEGDLFSEDVMARAMADCDVVFHCAALADDWGKRQTFYRINVEGTESVLRAARKAKVSVLVHVSTEAVLCGERRIVGATEDQPLARHPSGLYPWSKGLAEKAVRAAATDDFRTVVVRPRFIWGRDDTTVLPKIMEAVQKGMLKWIGGGNYLTSTCHVDNVCEGCLCAAEKGRSGEVYFLTDGAPVNFREFISQLLVAKKLTPPKSLHSLLAHHDFGAYFRRDLVFAANLRVASHHRDGGQVDRTRSHS
ncbi:hypothetical protein E3A20_06710 [Planctomyces bekefii]|uniref:3-beta hydroxysteroid dehydrogenase/isomerase domain-containing protein n=1 Tax=Planctomyces bekefii TaxID=1653850 RepID=A0A5C6MC64_9PLAN|nr:hypothetical protein E3A20_06710 [Planctomyces bekefii]